jgi:hypothetical protein
MVCVFNRAADRQIAAGSPADGNFHPGAAGVFQKNLPAFVKGAPKNLTKKNS